MTTDKENIESAQKDTDGRKIANSTKNSKPEEELNEEDQKLKDELDMLVERIKESDDKLYLPALESLRTLIRTSTSSMTAVPKPLKFLRDHFEGLVAVYESWSDTSLKSNLADILSVTGMTHSSESDRQSLKYRLLSSVDQTNRDLASWGHEYVRHLALEIGAEFNSRQDAEQNVEDLLELALQLVPFFLSHNAEADAVDLLLEIEAIEHLPKYVDKNTYRRVCLYMTSCVPFLAPPDDEAFLHTAYDIYLSHNQLTQALALAIKIDDMELIQAVFCATTDESVQKQLAFIVARQNLWFEVENESVQRCLSNVQLSQYFLYLAKELDLLEPKLPEDIYKSHLDSRGSGLSNSLDSPKQMLAASFVNAFVNCGYGHDKLIITEDESKSWIYKTKASDMALTVTSIGCLYRWNFDSGLQELDKYMYSSDADIKSGALLGIGVLNAGVHDESDPALALLSEFIGGKKPSDSLQTSFRAIQGLGLAYAGTRREDLGQALCGVLSSRSSDSDRMSAAALALGLIFVGSGNGEIATCILEVMFEWPALSSCGIWGRCMALGLALLYMGKPEQTDEVLETIKAFPSPVQEIAHTLVTLCSYAGTGNVLQIQTLLQACTLQPQVEVDEIQAEVKAAEAAIERGDFNVIDTNPDMDQETDDTDGQHDTAEQQHTGVVNVNTEAQATSRPRARAAAQEEAQTSTQTEPQAQVQMEAQAEAQAKPQTEATPATSREASSKTESAESKVKREMPQAFAVLGLAVIAMGEDIGQDMMLRHFGHLMYYGDAHIRRAVPLAMGLVSISNPQMKVIETLSRYSHDSDVDVAAHAIFAMGIIGAGTNNARLAQLLRQLANYYDRNKDALFMVRIAQGLLHLGKGTLTLSPFHTDRQNFSRVALAGLLSTIVAFLEPTSSTLRHSQPLHQFLYFLTPAMRPRMLVTLDENLDPIKVSVRVGQAVDVVGQAGKPKTITGWVTHSTPVLLSYNERAELENDEYISLASSLEGVVILRKNKDRMDVD